MTDVARLCSICGAEMPAKRKSKRCTRCCAIWKRANSWAQPGARVDAHLAELRRKEDARAENREACTHYTSAFGNLTPRERMDWRAALRGES